jgi:undecaprenyl-diphosphatase
MLAFVQGILEWLPVSSEGQTVAIISAFTDESVDSAISLSIWLHVGTMLAVIIRYRYHWLPIIRGATEEDRAMRKFLFWATLATGIVGFPIMLLISHISPMIGQIVTLLIGIALIFTAGAIRYTEMNLTGKRTLTDFSIGNSFVPGGLQGLAIIPGISRSGITMSGLLFQDLNKEKAIETSFLMSVPAVFAAFAYELLDLIINGESLVSSFSVLEILLAIIVTMIIGYLTIDVFLRIAKKYSFSIICLVLGVLSILLTLISWLL